MEAALHELAVRSCGAEPEEVKRPEHVGEDLPFREGELSHEEPHRGQVSRAAEDLEDDPAQAPRAPRRLVRIDEGPGGSLGEGEQCPNRFRPNPGDLEARDGTAQDPGHPHAPSRIEGGPSHGQVAVVEKGRETVHRARAPNLPERPRRLDALPGVFGTDQPVELAGGRVAIPGIGVSDEGDQCSASRDAFRRLEGRLEERPRVQPARCTHCPEEGAARVFPLAVHP